MKTNNLWKRGTALLLALNLLLTLAACGSKTAAATMHLIKTEGSVAVADDAGKDVELLNNLGLYSGYGVDTQSESYAWINLDDVKLTKMDEDSEIEILKEDKHLTIEVKSGALFFNVTEPLEDDETMDIRTSTMMVGIRGTCGWVEVSEDGTTMTLYLLEGVVECSVGDYSVTVHAGEKAVMNIDGTITVTTFVTGEIPEFVWVELEKDDELVEEIEADSGIDVLTPAESVESVMLLRDQYTYSRALSYTADGELSQVDEFFPDEQGRIGGYVNQLLSNGRETVAEYIYNDAGTLQAITSTVTYSDAVSDHEYSVVYTITEDSFEYRKMVRQDMDFEYIDYYDEQGRLTSTDCYSDGALLHSSTYTYDTAGRLIREDNLTGGYILYEYD